MDTEQPKNGRILNSRIIYLWMSELLSIVVTSTVSPIIMVFLFSTAPYRDRESVFAIFAIIVAMLVLTALAWITFWNMTKYFFKTATRVRWTGEDGDELPMEITGPATDIIKCLAFQWIIMVLSVATVIVVNLISRDYFVL